MDPVFECDFPSFSGPTENNSVEVPANSASVSRTTASRPYRIK